MVLISEMFSPAKKQNCMFLAWTNGGEYQRSNGLIPDQTLNKESKPSHGISVIIFKAVRLQLHIEKRHHTQETVQIVSAICPSSWRRQNLTLDHPNL